MLEIIPSLDLKNFQDFDYISPDTHFKAGNFDILFNYTNISTRVITKYYYARNILYNRLLLEHLVNHSDMDRTDCLVILACVNADIDVLMYLIDAGACYNIRNIFKYIRHRMVHANVAILDYFLSCDTINDVTKDQCIECIKWLCSNSNAAWIERFITYLETRPDCEEIMSWHDERGNSLLRGMTYNTVYRGITIKLVRRMIRLGAVTRESTRLYFVIGWHKLTRNVFL